MKYAFMRDHRHEFTIEAMCRVLEASKSGFFAWLWRDADAKRTHRSALLERIIQVHQESRKAYGSPRVFMALKQDGVRVAKATVERS